MVLERAVGEGLLSPQSGGDDLLESALRLSARHLGTPYHAAVDAGHRTGDVARPVADQEGSDLAVLFRCPEASGGVRRC